MADRLHISAHKTLIVRENEKFVDGFCHAVDELMLKAEAERREGRLGGAYELAASYLFSRFVPADGAARE
jgi:hypothetical protein